MIKPKITANIEKLWITERGDFIDKELSSITEKNTLKEAYWNNFKAEEQLTMKDFNIVFNFRNQQRFMLVEEGRRFKLVCLSEDKCFTGEGPAQRYAIENEVIEGVYTPASLFYDRKCEMELIKKKEEELAVFEKLVADLKKEVNQI